MSDDRQNQSTTVSNLSNGPVDNVEEGIRRMKIENGNGDEEGGNDSLPSYPDRPGKPDCIYYLRTGFCEYGSKCRFNHPAHVSKSVQSKGELSQRAGQPDCEYVGCKTGSSFKIHHPNERGATRQATLNSLGLPIRQRKKSCSYYMRTRTCKFGVECRFNHPEPFPAETVI